MRQTIRGKSDVLMEVILGEMGYQFSQTEDNYLYRTTCPFHSMISDQQFFINIIEQQFECRFCGKSGDVVKLVQLLHNTSRGEALHILNMSGL